MYETRMTIIGEVDKRCLRFIDLTDMTFDRLTVIERAPRPAYNSCKGVWWLCRCSCGNEVVVPSSSLRLKRTRSCGCLLSELARAKMDYARKYRWKPKEATS